MYRESYEEYMRNILGYPVNRNIYDVNENLQYNNYSDYNSNSFDNTSELEQYYPEIYNNIYPKIRESCLKNTKPINQTLIDNMVEEIYNSLETNQENRTNTTLTNNVRNTIPNKTENRNGLLENRQRQNNNFLRDLIRILLLRELTGRPGRPPRPRPPVGPGPRPPFGRPPIF